MPSRAQYFPNSDIEAKSLLVSLNLKQCKDCGLVQILGKPVDYYREVIRSNKVSGAMRSFRLAQLRDFVEKYNLKSRLILEVGCGNGDILEILRELKCNFHGMEHKSEFVENLEKDGYKVFAGYPSESQNLNLENLYSAFLSLNVLEHTPNIKEFLSGIRKMLNPDAVGLIEVPNFEMIVAKGMISEFMLEHLTYFDRATLRLALESSGFEIIDIKEVWHNYMLSAVVRLRPPLNIGHSIRQWNLLKNEIHEFFNTYTQDEICVWGAGHQSLAVISILELQNRIKFIVDSSKNKQGLFAPSSGIPIVAPEVIKNSSSVKCVLVMGGSYTQEIIESLSANFSNTLKIITIDGTKLVELK
jgi:2-polyprenyl-3-methyl-5-hydroxy-6-metoxy-1,4-benzoquinol methylase